jgi:hypothetical protein
MELKTSVSAAQRFEISNGICFCIRSSLQQIINITAAMNGYGYILHISEVCRYTINGKKSNEKNEKIPIVRLFQNKQENFARKKKTVTE